MSGPGMYNVGLTDDEFTLLIRLIDIEDMTDEDEEALRGIRAKLRGKRKMLRHRERKAQTNAGQQHEIIVQ